MKRAAWLFITLTASSALLTISKPNDNNNVTLIVNAVCTATSSVKDPGNFSMQDSVTVTMTETITFRVVDLRKGGFANLEVISHTNSLSASGGGVLSVPVEPRKWSYTIKGQVESPLVGLTLDYGEGFLVVHPVNFVSAGHLKPTDDNGPAGGIADTGVGDAVSQLNVPTAKQDFAQQCKKTFKPWPKDLYVSGSASHHFSLDSEDGHTKQSADLTMTYTVSNNPSQQAEAEIIPPSEYASWVPEASKDMEKPEDQKKPGNTIEVKARVHKKDDPKTPFYKKARFKFQLINVSKEQGVCLNWPDENNATHDYDLKIEPKSNDLLKVAGDGQSAESAAGQNESTVTITSYDWGAHGKLKVTVVFDDGSGDTAHVLGDRSKQALTIPKDDNGNHIADFWEKHYIGGSSDAKADDDLVPIGNTDKGDGLSLYEEYRGFRVQSEHIRTSPIEKDLFVRDDNNLTIGYFAQSGLIVHLIEDSEYEDESLSSSATNAWVINNNRSSTTTCGQQHILRMWNENMPGLYGLADGTGPGTPKTTKAVKIDVASCLERSVQKLQATIAHELSHGCNVWHHGGEDYKVTEVESLMPNGTWAKSTSDKPWTVSVQGGEESGVEECIMRYDCASYYETPTGSCRWKKPPDGALQRGEPYPPPENPGTIFCNDPKGTGVNAPKGYRGVSKAGNASKGNCKSQFCVNDNKH
jgi:hypothetical protein